MAIIDVLDAVEIRNDEDTGQEETQPLPTTEKPPLKQQYEEVKGSPVDTKGMTKTGQSVSESASYGQTRGTSEGTSTTQQEHITEKVEPKTSMEQWREKYKYKDWADFSKDIGYTPPSKEKLEQKQKDLRTTAWIKGLGGVANELAKMIGVQAGGDAAVGQYTIPETEEAKKAEEDYLKKLEAYKTKGLEYELGLRDKYAQYMQNMASTLSRGVSDTQTQSAQEGETLGQQVSETDTLMNTIDVNIDRALKRSQINKLNEKDEKEAKPAETYPKSNGNYFSINAYDRKNRDKVNRGYQYISTNAKKYFTPSEQKELSDIVTKSPNRTEDEQYDMAYRYMVAGTKLLLDKRDKLLSDFNYWTKAYEESKDPYSKGMVDQTRTQINEISNELDKLDNTGINIQEHNQQ